MNMKTLLLAADIAYGYTEADKALIREMAKSNKVGLMAALQADPMIPWVAYQHNLTTEAPKQP